jgi:Flp pilus assembly protein TadG
VKRLLRSFSSFFAGPADDAAQSLVEFALLVPFLSFILLGGVDLGRAYAQQLAVQNAARAGAEAAAIDYSPTPAEAVARTSDELSRTAGLDPAMAMIDVSFAQNNGVTACVNPTTLANPCFATVRVRYTFRTVVAWPFIPNQADFDRSNRIRMVKAP